MEFGDWVVLKLSDPRLSSSAFELVDYVDYQCSIVGLSEEDVISVIDGIGREACEDHAAGFNSGCECDMCGTLGILLGEWYDPAEGNLVLRTDAIHNNIPQGPGVYFLRDVDIVKIGVSAYIRSRFRTHRGSNLRLTFLAAVKGDSVTESIIHSRLAKYKIEGETEWFHMNLEIDKIISEFQERGDLLWR